MYQTGPQNLGFADYYQDFLPWHAKLVAPLHAITGINATYSWGVEQPKAFNNIKFALMEATALAQPDSEWEIVLRYRCKWRGNLRNSSPMARSPLKKLRPIIFGSKKLTTTQAKYGAPKLEMYAAHHFILKYHSYLCPRKFTLRVDNQALSWLKAYSTDQAIIRRWIMALEKYHFKIEHRPRTQHRNADGLSKRTNDYKLRAALLGLQPAVVVKWIF